MGRAKKKRGHPHSRLERTVEPMEVAVLALGPEAVRWREEHPASFVEMCATALRRDCDLSGGSLTRNQWKALERAMSAALAEAPAETLEQRIDLFEDMRAPLDLALHRVLAERLPSSPRAQAALARRLIQAGQDDEAASVLRRAVELDPAPENLVELGSLLVKLRRPDEATEIASMAADRYPDHRGVAEMVRVVGASAAWV